jgi:predicted homoserine dehydrogenase-like protein
MQTHLPAILAKRIEASGPVRVGVIGAGKFGSMFLNQVPFSPHLSVVAIADLDVERARTACRTVGWSEDLIAATRFTDDSMSVIADPAVEVVMEVTGSPAAGCTHALAAAQHGKHIVMVNVEADVLAGPVLAAAHRSAGTVYSMASGDQPALVCEIVDWARTCGLEVVSAGKGTRYQPGFHDVTPDGVWDHYGLTAEQAAEAGMNSQMFNSFLDGTKSAIEMAAIANANGLDAPADGLKFPAVDVYNLQNVLIPKPTAAFSITPAWSRLSPPSTAARRPKCPITCAGAFMPCSRPPTSTPAPALRSMAWSLTSPAGTPRFTGPIT